MDYIFLTHDMYNRRALLKKVRNYRVKMQFGDYLDELRNYQLLNKNSIIL